MSRGPVEFRYEQRGPATVVVFYGGHMRAGLALGEEVFADGGCSVLVVSRPGYGRTPVTTGESVAGFADVTAELCAHLGIDAVAAAVGVSAGGPTVVAMTALHPVLVERLILQSAVGPLPWPDRRTRIGARLAFAAGPEAATWAAVHALVRHAPETGLRLLLRDLTVLPVRDMQAALRPEDRAGLVGLFSRMRSGHGFVHDLKALRTPATLTRLAAQVRRPALVIASRKDAAVPFAHAQALASAIPGAELVESQADGHLVWFGRDWPSIAERIRAFLTPPEAMAQPSRHAP
ncbi:alpha/beta hydrolase [Streptomyces sp. NBC_01728]|uniref:alpha/beta fold hydrolase n=1 Tax=unclassified Streptomyces TaxID=2593676 RepID=UPI0022522DD8|nr:MULTISPECIES: alpha/beta hydrolase [unclassified Streptomyces]MCX4452340.1 alpha/beta hydrolase [Streptomyces sp. NBC_01719]MCX4491700.1 alpha/beta hydrolase [Streptomyces sp. NBC_01728]